MKMFEIFVVFLIGAIAYPMLEILWRGYTHWSMSVAGGICFSLVYVLSVKFSNISLLGKCILGAIIITGVEFAVGCVVNLMLGWEVWNYSASPGNIWGQICPIYSMLWAVLCVPIVMVSNFLNNYLKI